MWVNRPYIDGLFTLWHGFGLGARDGNFERFESWIRSERFPAPDESRNPLSARSLVRRAVTGELSGPLTDDEDDRAVALLAELFDEFEKAG